MQMYLFNRIDWLGGFYDKIRKRGKEYKLLFNTVPDLEDLLRIGEQIWKELLRKREEEYPHNFLSARRIQKQSEV